MADGSTIGRLFLELALKDEKFAAGLKSAESQLQTITRAASTASQQAAGTLVKVTEAERQLAAAIKEIESSERARAEALGVSITQLRAIDKAQRVAAESAAASAKASEEAARAAQAEAIARENAARAAEAEALNVKLVTGAKAADIAASENAARLAQAAAMNSSIGAAATARATMEEKRALAALVGRNAAEKARAQALNLSVAEVRAMEAATKASVVATGAATVSTKGATQALVNLGRQGSDAFTQLAMGVNPLMILIQQGPQIAESTGHMGGAFKLLGGWLLRVGPAAAVVTAALAALTSVVARTVVEVVESSEALNSQNLRLVEQADHALFTAEEVEGYTKKWEDFLGIARDVQAEVDVINGKLSEEGAALQKEQDRIDEASRDRLLALGKEVAVTQQAIEAARELALSPTHQADALAKLRELEPRLADAQARLDVAKGEVEAAKQNAEIAALYNEELKKSEEFVRKREAAERKAGSEAKQTLATYERAVQAIEKISAEATKAAQEASREAAGDSPTLIALDQKLAEIEAEQKVAEEAAAKVGGGRGSEMAAAARAKAEAARATAVQEFIVTGEAEAKAEAEAYSEERRNQTVALLNQITEEKRGENAKVLALQEELNAALLEGEFRTEAERAAIIRYFNEQIAKDEEDLAKKRKQKQEDAIAAVLGATKSALSAAESVAGDLVSRFTESIDTMEAQLEASVAAEEKLSEGQALSEEERQALLTGTQKAQLEERIRQQREAALVAFRIQQAASAVNVAITTAEAVMQAMTLPYPANIVAAAAVGALGIAQEALILSQEPSFDVGGAITEQHRRRSPGDTPGGVRAQVHVGEHVATAGQVRAVGGHANMAALIEEGMRPSRASVSVASVRSPDMSELSSGPPASVTGGGRGRGAGSAPSERPIMFTAQIEGRTFDTVMVSGMETNRTPKLNRKLRRMTGARVGLDL